MLAARVRFDAEHQAGGVARRRRAVAEHDRRHAVDRAHFGCNRGARARQRDQTASNLARPRRIGFRAAEKFTAAVGEQPCVTLPAAPLPEPRPRR